MPSITAMTLNARGVAGAHTLRDLLVKFAEWAKSHGLAIICLQEHNLDPSNFADHRRLAKAMGFTLEIVHGRADDVHSQRGGVLMVSYDEKVTRKKGKTLGTRTAAAALRLEREGAGCSNGLRPSERGS